MSVMRIDTKPTRPRRRTSYGAWPSVLAIFLVLAGCATVRRDLPEYSTVAASDPQPIDGIWLDEAASRRFRIEAGRIWLLDPWIVGPLRIDPGQVLVTEIRQVAPNQYSGKDIAAPGTWTAVADAEGLSITVYWALPPVHSSLVAVELDDRAWYDEQLASNTVLGRIAATPPATARTALNTAQGSTLAETGASGALQISNRESFGRYHALVIGNNAYRHLPKLVTAAGDARSVSALLRNQYDFASRR